jgi:hypothetical protein
VRGLRAGLVSLLLMAATPALGQEFCGRLTIPPELGLTCTPAGDSTAEEVAIAPVAGTFALLSRMTLRRLDRSGADATAWSDPGGWLQSQMRVDVSALEGAVNTMGQDPDSPFAGGQATAALDGLKRALAQLTKLALTACDQPEPNGSGEWHMRCNYTADGLGVLVALRLLAVGDTRWGITMRAANEQRLRHFEAIANSFQAP